MPATTSYTPTIFGTPKDETAGGGDKYDTSGNTGNAQRDLPLALPGRGNGIARCHEIGEAMHAARQPERKIPVAAAPAGRVRAVGVVPADIPLRPLTARGDPYSREWSSFVEQAEGELVTGPEGRAVLVAVSRP